MKISNERIASSIQKALVEYGVVGMKWGNRKSDSEQKDAAPRAKKMNATKENADARYGLSDYARRLSRSETHTFQKAGREVLAKIVRATKTAYSKMPEPGISGKDAAARALKIGKERLGLARATRLLRSAGYSNKAVRATVGLGKGRTPSLTRL